MLFTAAARRYVASKAPHSVFSSLRVNAAASSNFFSSVAVPPAPTSNHRYTPLPNAKGRIIYTETDEAPALATYSLYPVISKFAGLVDLDIQPCDISVAGRVLGLFPECLKEDQRVPDNLSYLGDLCKTPEAAIVKLPNISAPLNQLEDCIAELRSKGYDVPMYPREPKNDEEREINERYQSVMGSAVNPVLREGNSDRRVAPPVKAYAQKNPHRMGMWSKASRTHVAHMDVGDYYASETSTFMKEDTSVTIELVRDDTKTPVTLKAEVPLEKGEVIDASFMDMEELKQFYEREMTDALSTETMLSLHLKATMMKVTDPILFGHCIKVFFKDAYEKHGDTLESIGANPNSGLSFIYDVVDNKCTKEQAKEIRDDFEKCFETRPWLAMVNSDKGITNLHAPNDIIIDASMPVVIRDSGKMWNKLGELEDTKCMIPDRCYATMYQEVISYVKTHGQFDVSTMGNVANVGLMAKKAEEYGSHDKTFEIPENGTVRVRDINTDEIYFEHSVSAGDLWRMAQTKEESIRDWVKLAVDRARATKTRTIFWLDKKRGHDATLIAKVNEYLKDHDTKGLDISIMKPTDAVRVSMERATNGKDTISVTGNVLRDYLTDLFPILELGTSAKMLSIVPLLAGGGLYETGAGGSAPKHVQQFVEEGHLRWDSLGEYLAIAVAFEKLADTTGSAKVKILGDCLNKAVGRILDNRKSPSRIVNQLDNRATNFYIALYWADFLSQQTECSDTAATYKEIFETLSNSRAAIVEEFKNCQGEPVDLGGYYKFDSEKAHTAMNPSATLNKCLQEIGH